MILVDSGALYALNDFSDSSHEAAARSYSELKESETSMALTQPVMIELWQLVSRRKNLFYADKLWELMISGLFVILDISNADLTKAFEIRKKYADSKMSMVDATSLSACERHKIRRVFTLDREHFGIYKPSFAELLEIVPEI